MTETTATFTHKSIDDMESIWRSTYRKARGELGIQAFGLGVMELPPDFDRIPRHVHTFDQQEEVYLPLSGSGWIDVGGERIPIDSGVAVRVGATASRTIISGPEGIKVMIVGGTPGQAYEPFAPLELGAPEPNPKELPGVQADELHESTEDYVAMPIEGCGAVRGQVEGVTFYPLGRALGTTAFGMAEIEIDGGDGESNYPLHSHDRDGQEEVYIVARGSGHAEIDGQTIHVAEGDMVNVSPEAPRKWFAGLDGIRLIAIGAPIGAKYESNQPTMVS
jgi:mannose-6-phosphate isomerase-like protein (cupin superfamily)